MVYVRKTLADCKQSLADRLSNGILPTDSATLSYWTRLLNNGVLYCADKLRLNTKTSLTTISGTIALPDDFILINNVFNAAEEEQSMVDPSDKVKQTGPVFWITGDQFNGFFLNTPSDATFSIEYAYRPTPMVSDSDKCVIPDIEAPVSYAYAKKRMAESDPFEDADKTMRECDVRMNEVVSAYSVSTDGINFTWN